MNVLYWNLCNEAPNEEILREAKQLIASESIDVACLSEVPYMTQGVEGRTVSVPLSLLLAQELGMEHAFEHTRTIKKTNEKIKGYGSAVLSRSAFEELDITTIRDDRFSYMTKSPDNKRVLISVRTEANPDIIVNSAHLSYALPLKVGRKGMNQERETLAQTLKNQLQKYQVVFGGDLNVKPGKTIDKMLELIGLKVVVDTVLPTFRSRHWFAGHIKRNLDRVFVSAGLKVEAGIGERRQSDHNPIIVKIDDEFKDNSARDTA